MKAVWRMPAMKDNSPVQGPQIVYACSCPLKSWVSGRENCWAVLG